MPVDALAPAVPGAVPPPGAAVADGYAPGAAAAPDGAASFSEVLNRQLAAPGLAPTVTLSAMVSALAGQPIDPAMVRPDLTPAAGVGTAGTRVADDWGISADRPDLAGAGPGAAVLRAGEQYLGVPYKWGGTSPTSGFDCSGFVQRAFADVGISLPRVSIDQSRQGVEVPGGLAGAQPGDLLFWGGSNGRPNHIAIYAGEGRMLVAPRTGDVVRYQEVTRTPDAVRRIV